MAPQALFLDCDDCLYQNEWRTEQRITKAMAAHVQDTHGVDADRARALYRQYGTTLKGLLVEGTIEGSSSIEEFLIAGHDIEYSDIHPDPELAATLARLRAPTWVFTAGTREHALRCMDALGLDLPLQGIVDVRTCKFESKHSEASSGYTLG